VKNLIGAIHQPHLVLSDVAVLGTLPPREMASGMAEVVKTAIIGSPALFAALRNAAAGRGARAGEPMLYANPSLVESCVEACARIKALIVEKDPHEHDLRRVLNLGHTFGHALEAAAGYGNMTHGEAVGIGLLVSIRVAMRRGSATADFHESTRTILEACGLPTRIPDVDRAAIERAMASDKKRRTGGLSFVLPVAPGDVQIVEGITESDIVAAAFA